MKKARFLSILLLCALCMVSIVIVACKPAAIPAGPESGVYYYEAETDEYTLSLYGGNQFMFQAKNETKTGTYAINGETLDLTFSEAEDGTIAATISGDVIRFTYEDEGMKFVKKIPYIVNFNSNGGSAVASIYVINGKTVQKAKTETPVRTGYTFVGWYLDAEFKNPFIFDAQIVTGDITLYARWAEEKDGQAEYDITYDLNYENAEEQVSIRTIGGKLYGSIADPVREGFIFDGWWVSLYEDGQKLSYPYSQDLLFDADTTLFAKWTQSGKAALNVQVTSAGNVIWTGINGISSYKVEITGPVTRDATTGATNYPANFAAMPAGDYVIKVTAGNNSETVYYKNKALARVSQFKVVEPLILTFSPVENAEKYYVTVDCGNKEHNHFKFDNGNSTYYDFSNCVMQEGGILFTVEAVADGYASSVSAEFKYERNLDKLSGLTVDEENGLLKWNSVANAMNYIVSVTSGGSTVVVNNGSKTSFSLKKFTGELHISVQPVTKGYNSPEATIISYAKTSLVTPADIRLTGTILTWTEVPDATSYSVRINGETFSAEDNSFDLIETNGRINWDSEEQYVLNVRANGAVNSVWSDNMDVSYYVMYSTLKYGENNVSWRHVVGATKYEVTVNDGKPLNGGSVFEVTDGSNKAQITFKKSGLNTISVKYFDGTDYSEAATVDVFVYAVEFDERGAVGQYDPVYVAKGDKMQLPSGLIKYGYNFAGWYNAPGGATGNGAKFEDETFNENGDTVLFAGWIPATYTVKLFPDSGDKFEETEVTFTKNFTLPVPTIDDQTKCFGGWFTLRDGKGVQLTDENGVGLAAWSIAAEDFEVYAFWTDGLVYTLDETTDTYSVSKGNLINKLTVVTVAATYEGKPVTTIPAYAFQNCATLRTINIPDSIKNIITVPGADTVFSGCSNLQAVNIYEVEGNREKIYASSDGVLMFHNEVDQEHGSPWQVQFVPANKTGDFVIPDFVNYLPSKIFESKKLEKITVPTSVTLIAERAFYGSTFPKEIAFEEGGTDALVFENKAIQYCRALTFIRFPARISDFTADIFYSTPNIAYVSIEPGGAYTSDNGMLYDAAKTKILWCPPAWAGTDGAGEVAIGPTVTTIGASAFNACVNITKVTIPYWVTAIENNAFYGCTHLYTVIFEGIENNPFKLTIGDYAFYKCYYTYSQDGTNWYSGLRNINFENGSNVVSVGQYAFSENRNLTKLTLPASMESIGNYAFATCVSLNSVTISESEKTLEFGTYVFSGCTKLTDIFLPTNVNEFDGSVFAGCTGLQNISVDENNPYLVDENGVLFNKNKTTIIFYPIGRSGAYDNMPDTVTEISSSVFDGNTGLTSITIGKDVVKIGDRAFYGCTALQTVTFVSGGTETLIIGEYAFAYCTALKDFELPNRVEDSGDYILYYAAAETVTIPESVKKIGVEAFRFATIGTISLSKGLEEIGDWAFNAITLDEVTIPNTVKVVGFEAFASTNGFGMSSSYRSTLKSVVFESGNENVVHFRDYIETGKTSFASYKNQTGTFYGYASPYLANIVLPEKMDAIGGKMFSNCTVLTNLTLPTQVEIIYEQAFYMCTALKEITIPNTVTKIGKQAFYGCNSLKNVTFEEGGDEDLVLEDGASGSGMFENCSALTEINLPERVTRIPDYAFYNCAALKSVTIPSTVRNDEGNKKFAIGVYAFYSCKALDEVIFADGGEGGLSVGYNSFYQCSALTSITFPARLATVTYSGNSTKVADTPTYAFDYNAFSYSGVAAINIKEPADETATATYVSVDGIPYFADESGNPSILIMCPVAKEGAVNIQSTATQVLSYAFYSCKKITSIEFANGEKDLIIGDDFYSNSYVVNACDLLSSISFPSNLKSLGKNAVYNNAKLKTVTFAENCKLETIGERAFYLNKKLQSIIIPASVTDIAPNAFQSCSSLKSVTFEDNSKLLSIGDNAFDSTAFTSFTLPATLESIGSSVFNASELQTLYITGGIKDLGSALNGCKTLTSVVVSGAEEDVNFKTDNGVLLSKDGKTLVYYPLALTATEYTVPDGVTSISASAFAGNSRLNKVIIPGTVTSIGERAFYQCSALNTVEFKEGTESLTFGNYVFAESSIISVAIPDRVNDLGEYAFNKCAKLTTVEFGKNSQLTVIRKYAFSNCTSLENIDIPFNVATVEEQAFRYCAKITSLTFGVNLTSVGSYSFAGTGLVEVTIPASWSTLVSAKGTSSNRVPTCTGLFANCVNLKKVTISEGITSIGADDTATTYSTSNLFNGCTSLATVIFPDSLKTIGIATFMNCGFTSLTIPNTITKINKAAFAGCLALNELTIEEGSDVLTIVDGSSTSSTNQGAFSGCTALETVNLDRVTKVANYLFYGCSALKDVQFGTSAKLVTIGSSSFQGCSSLTGIDLPNTVTTINGSAFKASGLTTFTVTSNITALTNNASVFEDCVDLEEIIFDPSFTNTTKTMGSKLFFNCSSLKEIALPNWFTTIGDSAFQNCTSLTSIVLPGSLKGSGTTATGSGIGGLAFAGCINLTSITIPQTVNNIKASAFADCTSLTTVIFSGTGTKYKVEKGAVLSYDGTKLFAYLAGTQPAEFVIPSTVTTVYDGAFKGSKVTSVTIPNSVTAIPKETFMNCSELTEVVFEGNITKFDASVFENCTKLESIVLPEGLTTTGTKTFNNCTALKSVTLPGTLTTIGSSAFLNCTALESIVIPGGVTSISANVFDGCINLAEAALPAGLTASGLGAYSFRNTAIKEVVIPNGVTATGTYTFYGCDKLVSVTLSQNLVNIGNYAFYGCESLATINWPTALTASIGQFAFYGCSSLTGTVTLAFSGTSATTISANSFEGCTNIERVVISGGIKYINNYVFKDCTSLKEVVLPDTVEQIRTNAFENCTAMTSITLTDSVQLYGGVFTGWTSTQTIIMLGMTEPPTNWYADWNAGCGATVQWEQVEEEEEV